MAKESKEEIKQKYNHDELPPVKWYRFPLWCYQCFVKLFCYVFFGTGSVVLALLIFPWIRVFHHDKETFQIKAREFVSASFRMFANVTLPVGKTLDFHTHEGESEMYYILCGKGLYNDNGVSKVITQGCVTLTPSGSGHGLKNIGDSDLEFIALIISD